MRPNLPTTIILALVLASPAAAQRSLFDQPVQNAPEAAPAAPAPAQPPAAPRAPTAQAPASEAPAQAEDAAPRAQRPARARKPRGPVPARSLSVSNRSPTALVGLEVSQDGRSAKLRKALAPGKKTRLPLPAFKSCDVSVAATFEGQPQAGANTVDICREKSLNFTN